MPRQIEFAGSSAHCERLLQALQDKPGVARLSLQRDASLRPPGDILTVEAANQASREIVNLLSDLDLLRAGAVTISEPNATIPGGSAPAISEEGNDAIWEEVGAMMRQDTSPSFNFLALMALAGAITAFGVASDTLHVVVGAMLIAPGFEPLLRLVFAAMGDRHSLRASLVSLSFGYLSLAVAAAISLPLALWFSGLSAHELATRHWASYWSSIQLGGVATSLLAGVAGGVIVSSRMKVLSTGVMVALALVPSAALVGMGLALLDFGLVLGAASRFAVEAVCVLTGGGSIVVLKRLFLHRRRAATRGAAS